MRDIIVLSLAIATPTSFDIFGIWFPTPGGSSEGYKRQRHRNSRKRWPSAAFGVARLRPVLARPRERHGTAVGSV